MKLKHYGIALVPACLAAFLFRAVELIVAIDPKTGYFVSGSILPTLFDGFLILTALFFASVLLMKNEPKPAVVRLYRATVFDTAMGIGGSVLLVTSALYEFFSGLSAGTVILDGTFLVSPVLWQMILSLFCAIFLIFFVTYPKRSAKQNLWRIFSLSLTVHYLFALIVNFQDLNVVFSRTFGIYLITFYGVAAASGINFSKLLARLPARKGFLFFTCMMAVMTAVRFADGVLSLIPGNPYGIPIHLLGFLADTCITLFMVSQMGKLMVRRPRKSAAEPPSKERESAIAEDSSKERESAIAEEE